MTRNAALDKTQHVGELALGAAHRTEEAHARAGGKGLDAARRRRSRGRSGEVDRQLIEEIVALHYAVHRGVP